MLTVLLGALVIVSDLHARRVPNAWLLSALLVAVIVQIAGMVTGEARPLGPPLLGLVLGLAAMLPFHLYGWMGAGDVKFFATLGFLLGAPALLPVWMLGSLLAGAHAVLVLMSRDPRVACMPRIAWTRDRLTATAWWQRVLHARGGRAGLPYAAHLGVAAIIVAMHPSLIPWSVA
ncbi:peptidase [Dyella jiangningensis]|nr:peptidase [Dyella jiangningensis]